MNEKPRRAVFAGLARNTAQFLPSVLRNIEILTGEFTETFIIIVENDSSDDTRPMLKSWMAGRPAKLIEMDGLAAQLPKRTERIAAARNRYMQEIAESGLKDFEYLVMLDMDYPNSSTIDIKGFAAAIEMLENDQEISAVFANQVPLYYDVWALRHNIFSPDDCWARVSRDEDRIGHYEAVKKHVFSRQMFIPPTSDPIEVDSAFGGLAIYRMRDAIRSTYTGLTEQGEETCEHVAFNLGIRKAGGRLLISPSLLNLTSFEHTDFNNIYKIMPVSANGNTLNLLAVLDHKLDAYRKQFPLYDERFPMLAAIYSKYRSGSVIDVGANIGDGLALCRMHGCRSRYIAVEGCKDFLSLLYANTSANYSSLREFEIIGKYIDIGSHNLSVSATAGTASLIRADNNTAGSVTAAEFVSLSEVDDGTAGLIKIDTDGNDAGIVLSNFDFLKDRCPVLWAEAEVFDAKSLAEWDEALELIPQIYEYVMAFDNFGFLITAGAIGDNMPAIKTLLGYIHNQRRCNYEMFGQPKIYYLDLAFFSAADKALYDDFLSCLNERRRAS